MKRRHFQCRVGSSLILVNADVNHKRGGPSIDEQRAAKSARKKARKGPCPDAQLDAVGHWPEKTEKRGRCALCTTQITFKRFINVKVTRVVWLK